MSDEKLTTSRQSKIYRTTIDIIFAVIIGQSFFNVEHFLIPIGSIFSPRGMIDTAGIAFSYFTVIIGWISYHRSIILKPHSGALGNARYAIDLFILFLVYYLVSISNPFSKADYGEVFMWVIPTLFFFYSVWDLVKYYEYKNESDSGNPKDAVPSIVFFYMSILVGNLYYILALSLDLQNSDNYWNNKNVFDMYFIGISFFLVLFYRLRKWPQREAL